MLKLNAQKTTKLFISEKYDQNNAVKKNDESFSKGYKGYVT